MCGRADPHTLFLCVCVWLGEMGGGLRGGLLGRVWPHGLCLLRRFLFLLVVVTSLTAFFFSYAVQSLW